MLLYADNSDSPAAGSFVFLPAGTWKILATGLVSGMSVTFKEKMSTAESQADGVTLVDGNGTAVTLTDVKSSFIYESTGQSLQCTLSNNDFYDVKVVAE